MKAFRLGMVSVTLLCAALLENACVRAVVPDGAAKDRGQGEGCEGPEDCRSGICEDRTCCESQCAATEACNLSRSPGVCAVRTVGEPCSGGEDCPTGFCADGVCCDGPCQGFCETCMGPAPGHCGPAPDNTDARGDCPAACTACFGGACSPALPGTDPGHACDAGQACGVTGACQLATGTTCDPPEPCSAGFCLGATCMVPEVEAVTADVLLPDAYFTAPMALTVDASGNPAMVVQQLSLGLPPGATDPISTANVYYLRRTQAGWKGFMLYQPDRCDLNPRALIGGHTAAMASVGRADVVFVATAFPQCTEGPGMPGVSVVWTGPSLSIHHEDRLVAEGAVSTRLPSGAYPYQHLDATFDGVDTLQLTWGFTRQEPTRYPLQVWTYSLAQGRWQEPLEVAATVHQWGPAVFLDGQRLVFWASQANRLEVAAVSAQGVQSLASATLPEACPASDVLPLDVRVVDGAAGAPQRAWVMVHCLNRRGDPQEVDVRPLFIPFTLAGFFGAPVIVDDQPFGGVSDAALVRVSPSSAAAMLFDRDPGHVAVTQLTREATLVTTPVSQRFLWGESSNVIIGAYGGGQPAVTWSADRKALVTSGGPSSSTSSRMFLWRPRP